MDSTPAGDPVILRNIRTTVSPPDRALALPSDALLFFLTLLMDAAVAGPLLREKVKEKSAASRAPLPPLVL